MHYYNTNIIPRNEQEQEAWDLANLESDSDDDDTQARFLPRWHVACKKTHRMRMLAIAEQYAHALPMLNWIHLGRIQFVIRRRNTDREVIALDNERVSNRPLLDRTFGLPTSGNVLIFYDP